MKSVIRAVASGHNVFVLLVFAAIGFSLFLTPPFDTFGADATGGKSTVAFFWNFLVAWLIVWLFRLAADVKDLEVKKGTIIPAAAFAAGLGAILGVIFS